MTERPAFKFPGRSADPSVVKIGNLPDNLRFLPQVREKSDSHGGQGQRDPRDRKREQDSDAPELEVSDQKVSQALESFHGDAQAQAAGLNASLEGQGPGLRVILKDGSGAIIRQFTGEEFLRLRESVGPGGAGRGKLLDRKF